MGKRPSYYYENLPKLRKLCKELGFEWEFKDPDEQQFRVYAATHVIDIWPARMTFHRVSGENILAREPYRKSNHYYGPKGLDQKFNHEQVKKLLETGEI